MTVSTCLECGHEGSDVAMTVVRYADPQPVEVAIAVSYDDHGRVNGNETRIVPGHYGAEWRCEDRAACSARLTALISAKEEPMTSPEPRPAVDSAELVATVPERPSWL